MRRPLFALACLLLAVPSFADDRTVVKKATPLFDGKTLNGWKMINTRDNFFVKDGFLVMNKGTGWLATEKEYADFVLTLHYRFVTPGADSGVFIRSGLEGSPWTNKGYQVQNMDNATLGGVVGMGVKVRGEHDAALVKKVKKPAGEWQVLTITARGKTVEVQLNGQTVATSDDITLPGGHIGLQAEGGILEFQRIEIATADEAK